MHMIFISPTFYKNVKTDKSHILSGKTHTFQMNMLLILLNYDSINVFFIFQEPTVQNIQFLTNKIF